MSEQPKLMVRCRLCGRAWAVTATKHRRACAKCGTQAAHAQQQLPLYPAGKRVAARAGKPRARA